MNPDKAPTMIIPAGTDIEVDVHGQLSIRTPGNLVIQDSGNFSTLESINGSIRIEAEAEVEAVNVRCAETCFIEGTLTAWKVEAESIHLEETAKANIVLQDTQRLEIGHGARLVGNFRDENELFLLFSRFASELRALPIFAERRKVAGEAGGDGKGGGTETLPPSLLAGREPVDVEGGEVGGVDDASRLEREQGGNEWEGGPEPAGEGTLPDPLFYALVILEREFTRPTYGPTSRRALEELVKLLRDRDFETLRLTFRTLFGRIVEPGKDVQRVFGLIEDHFRGAATAR
jgi:hypothetical protein